MQLCFQKATIAPKDARVIHSAHHIGVYTSVSDFWARNIQPLRETRPASDVGTGGTVTCERLRSRNLAELIFSTGAYSDNFIAIIAPLASALRRAECTVFCACLAYSLVLIGTNSPHLRWPRTLEKKAKLLATIASVC